jgi:hypothetical protein
MKCDIVIYEYISKEQICAFCWFGVVNLLTIMHGMNHCKQRMHFAVV